LPDGNPTRVKETLAVNPTCEFKLSPTASWSEETFATLIETDAVRVLNLNGQAEGFVGRQPPDSDRYRRVFETFPDALVEDPAVSDDIQDLLAANADRLSWDAPIQGVADLRDSPFEPNWCTITPSRFGTVQSLFETIEYCNDQGISMYGGGQFELCVGRGHIQLLASLFYPDGPNDVAPRAYNEPEVRTELIESPSSHPQTRTDWVENAQIDDALSRGVSRATHPLWFSARVSIRPLYANQLDGFLTVSLPASRRGFDTRFSPDCLSADRQPIRH